jgi:hypothetical protein
MTVGEQVVYTPRVALYGIGKVVRVLADGRLRVRFSDDSFEEFAPDELESWEHQKRAEKAKQRQAA